MIRVRIRGIAATALSRIVLDKGYSIVQASQIIQDRLGIGFDESPADVTIKDSDRDELLVLGFYGKADKVYDELVEALEYVYRWVSPLGLYSLHIGRVVERENDICIVELPGGYRGILSKCSLEPGRLIPVSVIRPRLKPFEEFRLSREVRVVGEYVSLIYGSSRITLSEHIRDRDRRDYLLALAATKLMGSGLGIHFRSSSRFGSDEAILGEIDDLKKMLTDLVSKAKDTKEVKTLYMGEFIGLIGLTGPAKEKLDHYRSLVTPTISFHHSYKTHGGCLSDIVDYSEKLIGNGVDPGRVSETLHRYILDQIKCRPLINIIHVKPDGRKLKLTPGRIIEVRDEGEGETLVVRRILRGTGVLDGLGVEKKPGDIDYMILREGDWWISHNYYRGDEWIGSYININTPPEILPDTIKYHDLAVDIIVNRDGKTRIVDLDELEKYYGENIITEKLYNKAKEVIEEIMNNPEKYIYKTV